MVLHDRLCLQTWDLCADPKTEDDEVIRCCVYVYVRRVVLYLQRRLGESIIGMKLWRVVMMK
jgi:hypothetical protein